MHTLRNILILSFVLLALPAAVPAQQPPSVIVHSSISLGGRRINNDTDSSKLTEYRDLRDGAFLPWVSLNVFDSGTGRFFEFTGTNAIFDDQKLVLRGGTLGRWTLRANWTGVPHNFSNKAQTPYERSAPGLLEAPATIPITFKKLATAAADAPGVLASDQLIADYQAAYLRPTTLRTESGVGHIALESAGLRAFRVGIAYDRRKKEGLKAGFGPIGDRPPRTLNIQLTEPVDYRTNDLTLSAEHVGRRFRAQFSYLLSDFANQIDTLLWENVFVTPAAGATFDTWDRSVSAFGRRPLPPDNRYHNVSVSLAVELPADSRLSTTFAYGRLGQDEVLLPYSYNLDVLANPALPRATAKAQVETQQAFVEYVINPARLNLRTWARYYGLDNNTPQSNWQYVTSDTSNLNGTVSYKNKRVNLPYASDRFDTGLDAAYQIGRSTFSAGYEREFIWRNFRDADTAEDRLTVSWRARPVAWANLRARYVFGSRDGDLEPFANRQSYWYTLAEANDADNPAFSFTNHPDMVRYDVADRRRHQGEFTLTLTPRDIVSIAATVRYQTDDFDSGVVPRSPLAETGIGEVTAMTPGDQLGLLEDTRLRYSLDASYMPTERFSLNAFLSLDNGTSFQRGIAFDENFKTTPSAIATVEAGPWTRKSSQWTADFDDKNWTVGFSSTIGIVPDRVILDAGYTVSFGDVDITYAGYGVTNFDGTPFPPNRQYAFSSPPTVNQDLHAVNVGLQLPLVEHLTLALNYSYERFRLDDWQQSTTQPWVEPVGSEFLLRDTSRDWRWGNRLFNLGSFLAPSYDAHIAYVAFNYRF